MEEEEEGKEGREGKGRPYWGNGKERLKEGGGEEGGGEYKEKEEKNSETTGQIMLRAKRNSQGVSSRAQTRATSAAGQPAPAGIRHSPRPSAGLEYGGRSVSRATHSHSSCGMGVGRTHRPPTLDEGVMEAKEEGSVGGRQVMGTRSWEAEAQEGRLGEGLGGIGGAPQITFSCSRVTYLREGQSQEGIQEINGSRTQEMALTVGEGKGRSTEGDQPWETASILSARFSP